MRLPKISQYPKELKIRDEHYKILFRKRVIVDGESVLGACDPDKKIIYILKTQSQSEIFKTLVHEILHGFEEEYNKEFGHTKIKILEDAILRFISDNFSG